MTYRDETESLRAEVAQLREELAKASAKTPMRWQVDSDGYGCGGWSDSANAWGVLWVLAAVSAGVWWVIVGPVPMVTRSGYLIVVGAVAWCIAFVRRVPR